MREAISYSVTPMLLGNNKRSRRLARRLFWRYGIRSSIFDATCSKSLKLMISARFSPLSETYDDEFTLLSLDRFAAEREENTCLLVPCSKGHAVFIEQNKQALEKRFIIRLPHEIEAALDHCAEMPYERKV